MTEISHEKTAQLMTIDELAKYLNVKVSWVRSAVFKREIPHIKVGHHVRFDEADIAKWIQGNIVGPDSANGT